MATIGRAFSAETVFFFPRDDLDRSAPDKEDSLDDLPF